VWDLVRFRYSEDLRQVIVYGRPRESREFYAFAEQATMQKHLDDLMRIQR